MLVEYGIEFEKVKYDVDRVSLVSEIGFSDEKVLVFLGYMDVVDVGDVLKWKFLFFEVIEYEGKIYGCGVMDMKLGLVVMIIVMIEFYEEK